MEPLVDAGRLANRLVRPGALWTSISTRASTGSTNADLAALARGGADSGTVLIADHQSRGRGRFARVWEAPPGTSLAISVLLFPGGSVGERWLWLPLVTGLAVAAGLRESAAVPARVKWPNDVLIGDSKVCGILSERVDTPRGAGVVIGMGVNTTLTADQLPVPTATSLTLAGSSASAEDVAAGVLTELEGWYLRWRTGEDLRAEYASACSSVGRRVRVVVSAEETVEGHAEAVDSLGRLLVRVDGRVRPFSAGDVLHLR